MNIEVSDTWSLCPDFAVRSAGFPVSGLDVFGPDEDLVSVARDPLFREAVGWQSRESLANAVDKLASGNGKPSSRRRWEDVVASYWQRYCAKNDTIGFFGPLAWGAFGETTQVRSGALIRERVVHFETWAMEALVDHSLPMHPFPERFLPPDTPGLARLLDAREGGDLDALDRVFEEVTGRAAARGDGDSGGGRTIAYLDCMRDLDVTLGPEIVDALSTSLPRVLDASRWWCGRVFARGAELLGRLAVDGPLAPQLGPLMGAGFGLWDQLGTDQAELQRRFAEGDFADWTPAWHGACFHSADLQLTSDGLIVLGDFHGGDNPLLQGVFARRHPDPAALLRRYREAASQGVHLSPPRHGAVPMTARSWPVYPDGDIVVTDPMAVRVQGDRAIGDGFDVPLAELLFLPIFVSALRSFDPLGDVEGRAQIGNLVIRRATWHAPSGADFVDWARRQGLPRRVFVRSPRERKPRYVDLESPSLIRAVKRFLQDGPAVVTEMLPAPSECFLGDYTSEFRIVAQSR